MSFGPRPFGVAACLCLALGCAAEPTTPASGAHSSLSTEGVRVDVAVTASAPAQADGPSALELTLTSPTGDVRVTDDVTSATPFAAGALVVTRRGSLVAIDARQDADDVVIAQRVAGTPDVAPDGVTIAFVTGDPLTPAAVHVFRAGQDRIVADGLAVAGLPTFSPDGRRVAFVGARQGEIAGLHIVDADGREAPRCLTNCGARAVGAGFVPPPGSRDEIRFEEIAP